MSFIIRIPEPCHEDWNKMQPDEKGKFCNVCSKSVYDFSNKSDSDIISILEENSEQKVCGHFRKTQINRPLQIKITLNQLPINLNRMNAFAVALFFVFGTFLFSCSNEHGQKVGEIGIESVNKNNSQTTLGLPLPSEIITEDSIAMECSSLGEVACFEDMINGGVERNVPLVDGMIQVQEIPEVPIQSFINEPMISGGISLNRIDIVEPIIQIDSTTIDTAINKKIGNSLEKALLMKVFPNPSNGEFNISYEVKKRGTVQIDIFDMNGSIVRSIVNSQQQHTGKYVLPVNLTDLANGIYLCKIIIDGRELHEEIVIEK